MAGGGTPGGLPLICRFSRTPGRQPVGGKTLRFTRPVSLPLRAGTLILVILAEKKCQDHALSSLKLIFAVHLLRCLMARLYRIF
jgi:hypothetical protein